MDLYQAIKNLSELEIYNKTNSVTANYINKSDGTCPLMMALKKNYNIHIIFYIAEYTNSETLGISSSHGYWSDYFLNYKPLVSELDIFTKYQLYIYLVFRMEISRIIYYFQYDSFLQDIIYGETYTEYFYNQLDNYILNSEYKSKITRFLELANIDINYKPSVTIFKIILTHEYYLEYPYIFIKYLAGNTKISYNNQAYEKIYTNNNIIISDYFLEQILLNFSTSNSELNIWLLIKKNKFNFEKYLKFILILEQKNFIATELYKFIINKYISKSIKFSRLELLDQLFSRNNSENILENSLDILIKKKNFNHILKYINAKPGLLNNILIKYMGQLSDIQILELIKLATDINKTKLFLAGINNKKLAPILNQILNINNKKLVLEGSEISSIINNLVLSESSPELNQYIQNLIQNFDLEFKYLLVPILDIPQNIYSEIIKNIYPANKNIDLEYIIHNTQTNSLNRFSRFAELVLLEYNLNSFDKINKNIKLIENLYYFIYQTINQKKQDITDEIKSAIILSLKTIDYIDDNILSFIQKIINFIINNNNLQDIFETILDILISNNIKNRINLGKYRLDFNSEINKKLLLVCVHENIINILYKPRPEKQILIHPENPFGSIREYLFDTDNKFRIGYHNQVGMDGGGISADFYFLISQDLNFRKYFINIHDYSYFNPEFESDSQIWLDLGLLIGRALIIDRKPLNIKLHPYIIYRILNYNYDINNINLFDPVFDNLDFIINIRKIYKMEEPEWSNLIRLGDITITDKKSYIKSELENLFEIKYQNIISNFLNGFWIITDPDKIKFISQEYIFLEIFGYNIKVLGSEPGTIQSRLETNMLKNVFLISLAELKAENNNNFIKIMRFWLGNPYIDIKQISLLVGFGRHRKLNICMASTCAMSLDFPEINPDDYSETELKSWVKLCLLNSIKNQDICDSANCQIQNN